MEKGGIKLKIAMVSWMTKWAQCVCAWQADNFWFYFRSCTHLRMRHLAAKKITFFEQQTYPSKLFKILVAERNYSNTVVKFEKILSCQKRPVKNFRLVGQAKVYS
jgi:hypothetical protein